METSNLDKRYFENRRGELDDIYNQIKPEWQELADFFLPRTVRFLARNVNKAPIKNKKIKDSTTLKAVRDFSSGMMTGATNPATNWFRLKVRDYDVKNDYETKKWCSMVEEIIRNIFNASNLYQKMPQMYKQLGVFGLSTLALERDENSILKCKLLPIGSYRIGKNHKEEVDTLCRSYMETARNLYDKFGEENVSDEVKRAVKGKRYSELFEVVHFVEPNKNYIKDSKISKNKKYLSVYYEVNNTNKFLSVSGYNKFPYVVFEGEANGEDIYPSECCGMNALPDAKQLMAMVVDEGKMIKKIGSPQLKGPAELKNKKLIDAPATFTENNQNGEGLTPIYQVPPAAIQPLEALLENKRNSIKELFFNDLFAMILSTSERGRTATEVNELKEEKMVLLSPLLEQVHSALKILLDWVFDECMERGLLPDIPSALQDKNLEIEFVSMLAQAQKAVKVSSMERFAMFTINLARALDPTLLMKLNATKIIEDYADYANINPEQLISDSEYEKQKAILEEKKEKQEAINALAQGSEVIKNIGGNDAFGGELLARLGL